ncbi:PREDICTED: longitudinals lacking protein isoform X2 [Drosophila arizonae]|uniref:Longitudinals lacking protein isoform X2 n=1 Tax=Drosophila arizonae TaxID=7263 RepID=A0ABM1PD29_DROAR|nr:PREDICTED: longitudinals lacking protein isoform X2 [Drosophila arizonae]
MDDDQQFCLRWNNHQSTLISVFDTLLENETLVDCTLAAEGKFLKAHKVVLSACSPYFATLLQEQYDKHPIFILKDVKYQELRAMMDYMYRGEVNISQDQLTALLKAAESLQIKGLSDNRSGTGPAAAAAAQQQQQAPKPDTHHRVKLSAPYTLEQTKRARITTAGAVVGVGGMVDAGDVAGSREGSSSPSRRRRKVRRRSMENDMHDNSNSSVLAAASNQSILQQTSAGLAASALVSTQLASGSGAASATVAAAASSGTGSQVINQPLTSSSSSSNVTKKTESAKLTSTAAAQGAQQQQQQQQQQQTTSDAINTDNVQQQNQGAQGEAEEMDVASGGAASGAVAVHPGVVKQLTTLDKSNHKQKIKDNSITTTEMVIEPKAEYDDDAHDENVEDLTLDEEDMTMEELDQAAGTSQGGEGSSQAYATWQHDRSQDELGLMAAQDAQQRDPQDLSLKENTAPALPVGEIQRGLQRSIINVKRDEQKLQLPTSRRKRLSVSEVSDMLFEFYKTKSAKAPKQQQPQQLLPTDAVELSKYGQVSPTSAETLEPSSIAAIAVYGAASETASKNLLADEMQQLSAAAGAGPFHPRLKYSLKTAVPAELNMPSGITAIPTSVLVANTAAAAAATAVTAPVHKPPAAAIAEALMRNGLHSFQQQLRAQEILRQQTPQQRLKEEPDSNGNATEVTPTKILENLLRKQQQRDMRHSECENEPGSSTEDEDDARYGAFEDIQLMDQSAGGVNIGGGKFGNYALNMFTSNANSSAGSMKEAQAQAFRQLEFTLSDYGGSSSNGSTTSPNGIGLDGEPVYECRHCGKKYRWKSTLRRHENVECGGKEPAHQCPYCPYKSKQRGNLGVHVRKHHTDLPQLPSKRRSKYSMTMEGGGGGMGGGGSALSLSGSISDDSQGKLIIDCNK